MALKDRLVSDLAIFFNTSHFAVSATYQGGPVTVIFDYGEDPDFFGHNKADHAEIIVKRSEFPDPRNQQTVIISGVTWRIEKLIEGDEQVSRLLIRKGESVRI